jgi:uncharacterized protein
MISDARQAECAEVQGSVVRWAETKPDVHAVAIVGSWARHEPRLDSDLDLVVLTTQKHTYLGSDDWIATAVDQNAPVVRHMEWGPLLTECRVRLESGFEIEFGFAPQEWASTDPVDPGTASVVKHGCEALYDPNRIVSGLLAAAR